MNQRQLLEAIYDKTAHIKGGLDAKDMDIVMNALDEREELFAAYAKGGFGALDGECARVAARIAAMDAANDEDLKAMMGECNGNLMEARRKIKELQTGKKATNQYHGAAAANRGAVFDFKQ